jgi:hypothetical protein
MGWFRCTAPIDPQNCASPNANTPPSSAPSQYPLPDGVVAIATIGPWIARLPRPPS